QSPAEKFLNITNIACTIGTSSSQVLSGLDFQVGTSSGAFDLARPMSVRGNAIPETLGSNKWYSVVTNQIYFKMGPNRFPSIGITTFSSGASFVDATCVIVGNLTDN